MNISFVILTTASFAMMTEASQTTDDNEALDMRAFQQHHQLIATLLNRYPTPLRGEMLDVAETLYQQFTPVWGAPEGADARENASRAWLKLADKLRDVFFTVRFVCREDVFSVESPDTPLTTARNIERPVLVEVINTGGDGLDAVLVKNDGTWQQAVSVSAQNGFWTVIPVARAETGASTISLRLLSGEETLADITLPVKTEEPAHIRGRLYAADPDTPWPGRVHALCSDNVLRHGNAFQDNSTLSEKPVVFRPIMQRLPFFYSDGNFEIVVPPGTTTVTLERGFEHPLVTETVTLRPGEIQELRLKSTRFLDMKELGWISGDTHVHWTKNSWDENEDMDLLALVQRAEDVRVVNNLTLYQYRPEEQGGPFVKPDHFPMGPVPGYCCDDYHIQMAEEYRNDNHYGHINLLGITEVIQPIATGQGSGGDESALDYPINRTAILEARRQGGIVGEAHNLGPFHTSDVPVNVALGFSDLLEQLEPEHYYRFLNAGFSVPLGNGSDHPARVLGCARMYVKVDGPFTYAAWLDGIRSGRTFTTSGPLLFLEVNGAGIGESIDVERGQQITVIARAHSRRPIGRLEVVSNGEVINALETAENEAELRFDMYVEGSRWFTARASRNGNYDALSGPDIAHTSALHALVEGKPVVKPDAVLFWIENIRAHENRVRTLARFANDSQRQEALAHIAEGMAAYQSLLKKE